jgi:hypothetical protein
MSGARLPRELLVAVLGVAAAALVAALVVRRRRPDLLAARPLPSRGIVIRGVLLSMAYQVSIICMIFGAVAAVGQAVPPMALVAVFGASQLAGIVPGMHGASPRDGALVVGLASLGVTWSAALGAVALSALLAWVPALLLGGGSFTLRRLGALVTARAA